MIQFLSTDKKNNTRKIWEEIFKEDSPKFLDYYYSEKIKNNEIIAKLIKDDIVSMLHLNPYEIFVNGAIQKTYYIVAVATLENHRKKGYMAEILNLSINFMNDEKIPFAFLRPAKEEIYLPFDFRYIYNHNALEFNENVDFKEISLTNDKYEFLADFINKFLSKKYNIFSNRTKDYIETLHKEVKSENGDIILLYKNSEFLGCYIFWGVNEKQIRAIFTEDSFVKTKEVKPLVMARIINLNSFFENVTSKNQPLNLVINLKDDIITSNNGLFKIKINKFNSTIEKLNQEEKNILNISISDLTSLFFGYKHTTDFTNNKNIIDLFENINLYNVFLDEEV